MALLVRGVSTCPICGRVIEADDAVVSFPAFVANSKDPLHRFSDASFHERCIEQDPDGRRAQAVAHEVIDRLGPGHRACAVCSEEISDPDDYFTFGYLTSDSDRPAFAFNYVQLHRSHIGSWPELRAAIAALDDLRRSGEWEGPALGSLIEELREHESGVGAG
jgi:predicted nucleic acid-binding Zn ribbon protein